jgi:isoleucyl-tRNA synthetase
MNIEIGFNYNPIENDKEIINIWKSIGLYEKWSAKKDNCENFNFMDGPPFVSSNNLHFGHILVSLMKSSVLYFKKMNGLNVINKLGYDTHGLPIEMCVNKLLDLHTRQDVIAFGIDKYNEHCKKTINSFSGAWKPIFEMVGRITNDEHYKTMDPTFMESVWFIFKEIFNKGLVYAGNSVMPYSIGCNTPLSNFEASQNYKDVDTQSVYVAFKIISNIPYFDYSIYPKNIDDNIYIVIWTTTPWTLPANMAICINRDEKYVLLESKQHNKYFIIGKNSIEKLFTDYTIENTNYNIIEMFLGLHLINVKYEPLYIYKHTENHSFHIVDDNYVQCYPYDKDKSPGSGAVHLAPGFGEDDFRVCKNAGVINDKMDVFIPIDENGKFNLVNNDEITNSINLHGLFYKESNKLIMKDLENKQLLIKTELYRHSYPFCWRTDTPLIYKAVHSWFIDTTKIRDEMLENNEKINWYPSNIGTGRFKKWLEDTKPWCISRNRFFGTPIPIWVNVSDSNDILVIGSIDELLSLSGITIKEIWGDGNIDLHTEFIDNIIITKNGNTYKRISEVFDCWFESGCVPYAQNHYPFSGFRFDESKPALYDFICEGIDQTRGWFYTLHVISTILFNKPAFKNVICSGLILAADGKKMSKNLGNFKNPINVLETFGSDVLRLYMLNLTATSADCSRFVEGDINNQTKSIMQWINSFKFAIEHLRMYENISGKKINISNSNRLNSKNDFDRWIISCIMSAIISIKQSMEIYDFPKCISTIYIFIENFTNWYLKFNRNRLKGKEGIENWEDSLQTVIYIINQFNLLVAPFMPFLSETIFLNLKKWNISYYHSESILLVDYPNVDNVSIYKDAEYGFDQFQKCCEAIRSLRNKVGLSSMKTPIKTIKVLSNNQNLLDNLEKMKDYFLREEINVIDILFIKITDDNDKNITITMNPKFGKIYKNDFQAIRQFLNKLSDDDKITIVNNSINKICGYDIPIDHLSVVKNNSIELSNNESLVEIENMKIIIDKTQDNYVLENHFIRMVIYHTQKIRKTLGLRPWNIIRFYYNTEDDNLMTILKKRVDSLKKELCHDVIFDEIELNKYGDDTFIYEYNGNPVAIYLKLYNLTHP